MARKIMRWNQKNQKNAVALVAGTVGAASTALATYPSWKVPALGATHSYADFHNAVGDFITYTKLDNGVLLIAGIIGLGIGLALFRK